MSVPQDLPFWQVNVPEHLRRDQCPDYLVGLSDKDRRHLSTPDSEFRVHSWPEVRDLVQSGRLDLFRRWPSELHRYRAFMYQLQHQHGSVAQFLLRERLGWEVPVRAQGTMFQNPEDTKILFNDWPYAVDPRIVHLVVWTKFPIEQDPATGILTARARRDVDRFVSAVFSPRVPREQTLWFRNWTTLKSVGAVEHFHVMLFDPDRDFVRDITKGDVPQCQKVGFSDSPL